MNSFLSFCRDSVLVTAVIAWFLAQVLKVIFVLIKDKKIDFSRFIGAGGMPSSHSSFVVSLAMGVGLVSGFSSTAFAISVVLALVVMYDAAGVRRAAGQQARILNKIVEEWGKEDFKNTEKKLKELLGHTPVEVFAGAVLGILIALLRHL
ncbi:MAG TPA: divergent PAP2 family protein [Candidatus Avimonoglobus intestinipullorum]|uniref:Divergent PAP2 family protein n=1 Tax=Candidatus Avimonoglobus intestinipullorum TaxID=2840699 RepID=A0A9D1S5L6_9FIRM|nr:divergent PAP2 family protein [Candidatus Avimonoglobus intestinipullorum]